MDDNKGQTMVGEPGMVREARELVQEYRRSEGASGVEQLTLARSRLRSLAAHPTTSAELRERVLGVLLVVDVVVRAAPAPRLVSH